MFYCWFNFVLTLFARFLLRCSVVQAERVHHNLLKGVEGFDKDSMKHTETQEKNPLPDPEGLKQPFPPIQKFNKT